MEKNNTTSKLYRETQDKNDLQTRKLWLWKTVHYWAAGLAIIFFIVFISEGPRTTDIQFPEGFTGVLAKIAFSIVMSYFMVVINYSMIVFLKWVVRGVLGLLKSIGKLTAETYELQEDLEGNFFTTLIKINLKYLDRYYLQTQYQASKSFILCATAAIIGYVILAIGIILMFRGNTTPAYVTTGAGVFSEFIASIFFYLYSRTVLKMGEYHEKLVLTQNISLALRLSEGIPEEARINVQSKLIEALTQNINQHLSNK